jgi:hypothetical protein
LNIYQTLNNAGSALIFAGVLAGTWKLLGDSDITPAFLLSHADSIFMLVFIVFFRIKMHLDDHKYFGTFTGNVSQSMYTGFILAVGIWFLMALAAGTVKYPETSAAILAISFAISTVWIVLHLREVAKIRVGSRDDRSVTQLRYNWITVNMLYIILLVLYNQEGDILITVHGYHVDLSKWGFILLMIGVMALDHFFSKPHLPDGEPSTPA